MKLGALLISDFLFCCVLIRAKPQSFNKQPKAGKYLRRNLPHLQSLAGILMSGKDCSYPDWRGYSSGTNNSSPSFLPPDRRCFFSVGKTRSDAFVRKSGDLPFPIVFLRGRHTGQLGLSLACRDEQLHLHITLLLVKEFTLFLRFESS